MMRVAAGFLPKVSRGSRRPEMVPLVLLVSLMGVAIGLAVGGSPPVLVLIATLMAVVSVGAIWGVRGIATAMLVGAILPLPTLAVRTADFGLAALVIPVVPALGLLIGRSRRSSLKVPYFGLYLILLLLGTVSIANSWLFWDPGVAIGTERGFGHRWIGYQLAGLFFLATPFLAFAGGVLFARAYRLTGIVSAIFMALLITSLVGLWNWSRHPIDPLSAFDLRARAQIDFRSSAFLIVVSASILLWSSRGKWRLLAFLGLVVGVVTCFESSIVNAWLGALAGTAAVFWYRWRVRGLLAMCLAAILVAILANSWILALVNQRAVSMDIDRIKLWQSALIVWSKSPIIGIGPGNFASYMEAFNLFPISLVMQGYQEAHNAFLELLAETGVIGAGLIGAFSIGIVRKIVKGTRITDRLSSTVRASALGVLVAGAVMASLGGGFFPTIASAGWTVLGSVMLIWFLAGCAVGISELISEPLTKRETAGRPHIRSVASSNVPAQ